MVAAKVIVSSPKLSVAGVVQCGAKDFLKNKIDLRRK
jgi:hypothetical protein